MRLRRGAGTDNLRIVAALVDTLPALAAGLLAYFAVALWSLLLVDRLAQQAPPVVGGMLMYYFAFEAYVGWTPGKWLLGLRVVRRDGSQPGTVAVAARNLARPLDYLPALYLLGMCSMLATGRRRQRLGDLIAGTYIVPVAAVSARPPRASRLEIAIGAVGIGVFAALAVLVIRQAAGV